MQRAVRDWTLRDPARRALENRFAAVTNDRLRRVFDTLSPRQKDVVELLPLLFHLNHPLLPGYVSLDTPHGIPDYTPTPGALSAARRLAKSFTYESRLHRQLGLRGLYLMGSAGTIAYTRDSDLDVWVCHDTSLGDEQIEKLCRKATLIEAFSQAHGLEVHFFVFDAERFRRGETLGLSAESSGSSQHYLLLDEFYRSGLLLAGLKPLWWYVPVEEEAHYDTFVATAFRQRRISPRQYVDFGGLPEIPPAEFFGAALWQLYKSIESPYKSVMKLLLMECYAAEYPSSRLLSHQYKATLSRPKVTLDELDPYIALYRKIETYLTGRGDRERLQLVRRAFYLKADEPLSLPAAPRQSGWRRDVLTRLVGGWGWSPTDIALLDQRQQWRIDAAQRERRGLVRALQGSYSVLSDFARQYGQALKITGNDLTILGRKLYAAFDRKPDKIEIITRGICQNPREPQLSLHRQHGELHSSWFVYDGRVDIETARARAPLKRGDSMTEVLAWCYFNRLADADTEWHAFLDGRRQSFAEPRRVLDAMLERFPTRQLADANAADLSRAPLATQALLFVNLDCDIGPAWLAQGDVLTSSHSDAFRFGGRRSNLLGAVDLVLTTSWGEIYCYRHNGSQALGRALCAYLERQGPAKSASRPSVYCFTPDYGQAIRQRVAAYVDSVCALFGTESRQTSLHHVVGIGDGYHELSRRDGRVDSRVHSTAVPLLKALGEPTATFRQVVFDANCADELPLAAAYRYNKRGAIQLFALQRDQKLDLYVIDEYGDLYVERQIGQNIATLIDHFSRFFASLQQYRDLEDPAAQSKLPVFEYYELVAAPRAGWHAVPWVAKLERPAPYVALEMFADLDADERAEFTCYCDGHEFSSRALGSDLFRAVAAHVLASRRSGERYPVYITHLELSERYCAQRGRDATRVLSRLEFKKRLEFKLTQALRHDLLTPG